METKLKSATNDAMGMMIADADSNPTFDGWSSDLSDSTNTAAITVETVIATAILPTIPPPPPTLVSPGSESNLEPVITTSTPTFEWNEVSEAANYGIYVRDLDANVLVFNSKARGIEITGSSYSLPTGILEMGKAYCWLMTSHNSAGLGYYGKILYFQTDEEATIPTISEPPVLISPWSESSPGPVITTSTPTFEWTEISGATDYGIYIRDLTANVLVFNSKELGLEITGSSYSLPSGILEMGKAYIWSMTSHNSAGSGDLAPTSYFQTEDEAPAPTIPEPPMLISPGSEITSEAVITTSTPTFEWAEVSGATDYGIYIRDLTANVLVFNSKELGLEITGSSYSLPSGVLEMGKAYIWSMTSHNSAGNGDLAAISYFQTKDEAPAPAIPEPPVLVSPGSESSPGPVITTSTPTFEWTEVSGAANYGVYIRDLTANVLVFNSKELGIEITGSLYPLPSGILEMGKAYIWSMTSHNSAGSGELAPISYFQTDGRAL